MPWKKLLANVTGSIDEELRLRNEYLVIENRILRSKVKGRLRFRDEERRQLAEIGKKLGRKALQTIATIVKPDTILRWHAKLIASKFDGSTYRRKPGRPATGLIHRPMDQWLYVKQDAYPAYISWDQYLANQQRLHQNATHFSDKARQAQGAARAGKALLQGLATCGACGGAMRVAYKYTPRYFCNVLAKQFGQSTCMSIQGPSVDQVVINAFFEAIQPAQLDALDQILKAQQAERHCLEQQWHERLQRAQYQVHLAERQYQAVDPDNRLVAAELERRWEEQLRDLQQTKEAFERFQQRPLPTEAPLDLRQQFRHISDTLPDLWPSLSPCQQKELLRSLIDRVILNN